VKVTCADREVREATVIIRRIFNGGIGLSVTNQSFKLVLSLTATITVIMMIMFAEQYVFRRGVFAVYKRT
jgi:lipoprotein signal peptidase